MNSRWLCLVLLGFSACSSSQKEASELSGVDSLEIYYRSFNKLTPVAYTRETLLENYDEKLTTNDPAKIKEFAHLLDVGCREEPAGDQMDMYVIVRMRSGATVKKEIDYSNFHFKSPDYPHACRYDDKYRERLAAWLKSLTTSKKPAQ